MTRKQWVRLFHGRPSKKTEANRLFFNKVKNKLFDFVKIDGNKLVLRAGKYSETGQYEYFPGNNRLLFNPYDGCTGYEFKYSWDCTCVTAEQASFELCTGGNKKGYFRGLLDKEVKDGNILSIANLIAEYIRQNEEDT